MTRTRWIVLVIVVVGALFALVVGGFLWPRPQWEKGPWNNGDRPPAEAPPAPAG
jgi:hypothetical protein